MTTTPARTHTPDRTTTNPDGHKTTTIRVKRACNGCGQMLGDATNAEIEACIDGQPLPDVRSECPTCGA